MNIVKLAIRPLFRKGESTSSRIISLATGLAFGILLLSQVLYYYSYDSFYPDAKRIYVVYENIKEDIKSDKIVAFPRVSGAIGPGLMAEVPGIEVACRLNSLGKSTFYTEEMNSYDAEVSLADEHLFSVLGRPVKYGDPSEILKTPMSCMVSTDIEKMLGGNAIGKVITLKEYPGKRLTVEGVFEALPENTIYTYDILISMISTGQFTWDGTSNWLGNDRYYTCVKLGPGVRPENLSKAVRKMQEAHQDIIRIEEEMGGMVLQYSFLPVRSIQADNMQDMIIILFTIAVAVLFVSLMNYILLTLSALANRAKSSAVYKTYGALTRNIQQIIFTETLIVFLIAIVLAVLIISAIRPLTEVQLGHSLSSTFNPFVTWPLLLVVLLLVFITAFLPGRFFSRIPVATVFRNYRQGKNNWKLALLAIQFIGSSFIVTLMIIVSMQLSKMKDTDHGYNTKGVYFSSTVGMDGSLFSSVLNELRAMPEVEKVGLGSDLPVFGASGNNIISPDGKRELFNVADFYQADDNFLSILDINASSGKNFSAEASVVNDLLISQKGAELLKLNNGWNDGLIGKQVEITEHGEATIRGIYPDFTINSLAKPDLRPSVFFYKPEEHFIRDKIERPSSVFIILIKVNDGAGAGILKKLTGVLNMGMPQNDAIVTNLDDVLMNNYGAEKGFRNATMAGTLVVLLITIIGLLGYTANEAGRRRKELAIRRINGANLGIILRIFILDLEYIALPSITVGLMISWITASKWMSNFAFRLPLHWGIFFLCGILILLIVSIVAGINYYLTANRNPVEALRYE